MDTTPLRDLYRELYLQQMQRRDQISSSVAVPLTAMAFIAITLSFLVPTLHKVTPYGFEKGILSYILTMILMILGWGIFSLFRVERGTYQYPIVPQTEKYQTSISDRRNLANSIGATVQEDEWLLEMLHGTYEDAYYLSLGLNEQRQRHREAAFRSIILVIGLLVVCYGIIAFAE